MRLPGKLPSRRKALLPVAGVALSFVLIGTASLFLPNASGSPPSAPGLPDSVSAMAELPTVADAPRPIAYAMERAAHAMGGDGLRATETLKLLRSDLGPEKGKIYAYSPRIGMLCVVHWPRAGTCATGDNPDRPDIALLFSPGGPGYPGQRRDLPAAVAAVVADNVSSVLLRTNGRARSLEISNNAIFGELAWPAADRPWDVALTVNYDDGSEAITELRDPRG